jgi:NTP pyrophosphatase (non-canonical NTP hydrolase)
MAGDDTQADRATAITRAIDTLQRHARELTLAQRWDERDLDERTMFLMTELGEVVREVLHLRNAKTEVQAAQARERLGLEIYDVVWNLCDLANGARIDLGASFAQKIAINQGRRW